MGYETSFEEGKSFTTLELKHQIREAPNFPEHQEVVLMGSSDTSHYQRITLAPLSKDDNIGQQKRRTGQMRFNKQPSTERAESEYATLELRFALQKIPRIEDITRFGKDLASILQSGNNDTMNVRRVHWGGIYPPNISPMTSYQTIKEPRDVVIAKKVVTQWRQYV